MSSASSGPGDGLRLLSFDGGGLHCISQALIVQDTLHRIEHDLSLPTPPKISDYFDMICGSGFGGLLAIMCGILHMTGDQLVDELVSLFKTMFSEHLDVDSRTAQYEAALKSMVERYSEEGSSGCMISDNDSTCKTFVCSASSHNVAHPRLFRNYRTRANTSPNCPIYQAARATTALPEVFNPIFIGQELLGETFSSGELRWINPADELTREASNAFDVTRHIACIVSGSGHPQHLSLLNDKGDIFRRMASDCEKLADDLERRFVNMPEVYRRINIQQGLQGLDRFDLMTVEQVVSHTRAFLHSAQAIFHLDSLVEDLLQRPSRILVPSACGVLPPASQVMRLKHVPPPTPYFVGRESLLQKLYNYFFLEKDLCHIAILYGLGGSGKTQGSLKFTEVFFVNASSQLTLENDLKAIAVSKSHKAEWLLFLDNADDPKLNLHPFTAWSHGNVLITSRNSEVRTHAPKCSLHVDSLEEEEAMSLLLLGVEVDEGQETKKIVREIVQELGCLALAINQARAFLAKRICNLKDYLRMYRDNRKTLLTGRAVQSTDDYKYSAYTTWTISFNQLSKEAALFLRLLCYMHHRSIPSTLFEDAQRRLDEHADYYKDTLPALAEDFLRSFCGQRGWDSFRLHLVVGEVLSFSLIQSDPTDRVFHFHPLVQKWMQDQSEGDLGIVQATKAILHWKLLYSLWRIYNEGGLFAESCRIGETELKGCRDCFGPEHPSTLASMHNLAQTYSDLGRHSEALNLKEQVVELRKRISGPEHPETLTSMHNLGVTYSDLGRHSEALNLKEQVVELRKRISGPEHPEMLASMHILAHTYSDLGRHSEALNIKEQVVELRKRISGPEHPHTLASMHILAQTYSDLGRHSEALNLKEQVVERRQRISGPEHPSTLASMHILALTYSDLGRHSDALNLKEQIVELRKRISGPEHPETLASIHILAQTYSDLGRHSDALNLKEHVLELRQRISGPEHPFTLASMHILAQTYSDLGRYSNALNLQEQVVELRKRISGPEHPETLTSMHTLAQTYSDLGRHSEALNLKEQVVELRERISGPEHPYTLTSMHNLGVTYSDLGRHSDAVKLKEQTYSDLGQHSDALKLKEQVVELRKRILGPEHPHTLTSLHVLALTYFDLDQHPEALDLMQQVLELRKKVLSAEHPHTLLSQQWLDHFRTQSSIGKVPKRKRHQVQALFGLK
ncbi:hypothetical protein DL96DRAFT_1686779 [Flagelloscypha sp. PMI_526]|nr:hypothetical protein DL96DRAFT_1686779 [Flagelloscypha sp. PMI_526]